MTTPSSYFMSHAAIADISRRLDVLERQLALLERQENEMGLSGEETARWQARMRHPSRGGYHAQVHV